jgi:hypothetical protein
MSLELACLQQKVEAMREVSSLLTRFNQLKTNSRLM